MSKEDKQFFIKLFKGLEGRFDNLEGRFDSLQDQVGRNYEAIQKNSASIRQNSNGIRHPGVRFEKFESDFETFGEKQNAMDNRLKKVESDIEGIKENTSDYPVLRGVVKEHSRLLTKLCR